MKNIDETDNMSKKKVSWQLRLGDFVPYWGLDVYKERISHYEWNWDFRKFVFKDKEGVDNLNDFYLDCEAGKVYDRVLGLRIWNFGIVSPLAGISLACGITFLAERIGCSGVLERICI